MAHLPRYEVIESRCWKNDAGKPSASIHGALPYYNEEQRVRENWRIESRGWTLRNNREGTIGLGRQPYPTRDEAEAVAARLNAQFPNG